jgi:hypothetical protein
LLGRLVIPDVLVSHGINDVSARPMPSNGFRAQTGAIPLLADGRFVNRPAARMLVRTN